MPTDSGIFSMQLFEDPCTGDYHVALVAGDIRGDEPVLVRLHSECLTGDVFGSRRCDCGPQLKLALDQIITAGTGVCLYLRQEGRGIGLANKLRAYLLQEQGLDTVEANQSLGFPPDLRDYKTAARILTELGVDQVRLMTNNPEKIQGLKSHGIDVVEQVPHHIDASEENENYLYTKQVKMGHLLPDVRGVQKCQP
ncbi:MAG: GTP cyclohydrolase II [Exilibacterium sp.]